MVTSGFRGLPAAGVHFLLCDFGELGRSFVETDPDGSSAAAVVEALLQGQYRRPLRVIVLMPQGIWRDVSVEIAFALARAAELAGKTLNEGTQAFLAEQFGRAVAA